jgi:hypothetical protein
MIEKFGFSEHDTRKIDYPIFILSKVEEYLKNNEKFKRLTAQNINIDLSNLIKCYEGEIDLNIKCKNFNAEYYCKYINRIKEYVDEYENYIMTVIFDLENKSKFDENYVFNDPTEKLQLFQKGSQCQLLTRHLDKSKFNLIQLNLDDYSTYLSNHNKLFQNNESCNHLYINILPLYRHRESNHRNIAKKKIITFNQFKLLNCNLLLSEYIDQFYELKSNNSLYESSTWKYQKEEVWEFIDRCKNEFYFPVVYIIEPFFNDELNDIELKFWHDQILQLGHQFSNANISNFIILPPRNNIDDLISAEEEYDPMGDYDIIAEMGKTEMDRWDEEDSTWRIANDLD